MGKKKSFIDRKHATTFRLVHRSQRDPLIVDEEAGKHVLQPVSTSVLEQRSKFGIYYADDYDYFQHLKTVGEAVELGEVDRTIIPAPNASRNLPSVIFETKGVELKVGLLNQGAPTNELLPDLDPDICAALDGDFEDAESGTGLEDDFVLKLNAEGDGGEPVANSTNQMADEEGGKSELMRRFGLTREERFSDESSDDEDDDDGQEKIANNEELMDDDVSGDREERRTRFTNYSMSSAVIKRPDGLQLIDEHFEALYEQYDDEKLGELDDDAEPIGGHIEPDDDRFKQLVEDYASHKRKFIPEKPTEEMKDLALKYAEKEATAEGTDSDDDDDQEDENYSKKRRWDCESILSTYSNNKNHPLVIKEAGGGTKRRRRQNDGKAVLEEIEKMDDTESVCTTATTATTIRLKGETAEERRIRKQAVREERRVRRVEKKSNKDAFKEQKKELERQRSGVHINTRPIN